MSKGDDSRYPIKTTHIAKQAIQNVSKLANVRVIQKHLVYVIGLSMNLANKEILAKTEYFGQYGTIVKIVVNKNKAYNPSNPNGPSFSAYISYSTYREASFAILAIDNIEVDGHTIRASFGTTKYCTFFLKSSDCPNKECLYLHSLAEDEDIISRTDMNANKNLFFEQQLLAIKLSDIFNPEVRSKVTFSRSTGKKQKMIFPPLETIYSKDVVVENDPDNSNNIYMSKHIQNINRIKKRYEYDDDYNEYHELTNNNNYATSDEFEYVLVRDKADRHCKKNYRQLKRNYAYSSGKDCRPENEKTEVDTRTKPHNSDGRANSMGGTFSQNNEIEEGNIINTAKITEGSNVHQPFQLARKNCRRLYRKVEKSRFDFAKEETLNRNTCDSAEVPDFVSDMIYKKISRYTFFKKFTCVTDKKNDRFFFEKELTNNNNSWAQFIKSNLSFDKMKNVSIHD